MNDLVGRTLLGKLRVVREIGSGGAGSVFEVEHTLTRHRRALKVIRPELCQSGEAVARLVREAGIASRIRNPAVLQTLDAGRLEDGRAYVLMELAEGATLRDLLDRQGKLEEPRALAIARSVADGLAAVHRAGLVHRDVKPANIIVEGPDDAPRVRLVDFGICKLAANDPVGADTLTRSGAVVGTPAYMAPEQLDADLQVGPPADVWSLGVVLFEMLTGRRPFVATSAAGMAGELQAHEAPRLRSIDPSIGELADRVVQRALSRLAHERYASAEELAAALETSAATRGGLGPGDVLGDRFEIVRSLGQGGAGAVYEVVDRTGGARRALKLLRDPGRADLAERLLHAGRRARELDPDHVPEVFARGVDRALGRPFIVMELCEGETVAERVARAGAVPIEEALGWLSRLAAALDAVHARGVVHRDVKPGNVMLLRGDAVAIKLLDFGVAKAIDGDGGATTASDVVLGTPLYMAPEQARSDVAVGATADRYALGQLAFTLLVGRAYFEPDARAGILPLLGAIGRGVEESATSRAQRLGGVVPSGFDPWFRKATASSPDARFSSSVEQVVALRQALASSRRWSRTLLPWAAPVAVACSVAAWLALRDPAGGGAVAAAPAAVTVTGTLEASKTTPVRSSAPVATVGVASGPSASGPSASGPIAPGPTGSSRSTATTRATAKPKKPDDSLF